MSIDELKLLFDAGMFLFNSLNEEGQQEYIKEIIAATEQAKAAKQN